MNENKLLGLAWISPYIIGLIVFTAFPFVSSFFLSFTEYDLMSPPVFNGIENYRYMLTEDSLFWKSMGVTFAYVFLTIPLKLAFALGIAFVLNFKLRGIGFFPYRLLHSVDSRQLSGYCGTVARPVRH